MTCPEWKTYDGFEMQIGTNHFGHFLLTELLIPLLRKSSSTGFTPRYVLHYDQRQSLSIKIIMIEFGEYKTKQLRLLANLQFRIVIVSSLAHEQGSIKWDDIHFQKTPGSYNRITAYQQSKLANVMHAAELARRVEAFGIRTYSLHPGNLEPP